MIPLTEIEQFRSGEMISIRERTVVVDRGPCEHVHASAFLRCGSEGLRRPFSKSRAFQRLYFDMIYRELYD